MGKQTTKILKAKASGLHDMYPDRFTGVFEENKKTLDEMGIFDYSKTDRNIVAGFVTRLKNGKKED